MHRKISGHRSVRKVSPLALCVLLLFLAPACKKKPAPSPPPPPKVTVVQPVRKTVTDYMEFTGNAQAVNTVELVARVAGYLEKVFFHDGQFVKEGQLLFLIEQDTYRDNLRQAEAAISQMEAQLNYAESQLKRYSDMVQQAAVSESDTENWLYQRDSARANLKAAQAQRDQALLNLNYTEVRAPFDGRIDRRLIDPGNLVGSGGNTVLARISQIDPIYVYFNIGDSDLARLTGQARWTPGQASVLKWPVSAKFLNEQGFPHRGYLDFAAISLTDTSGTLLLRGVFPNSAGRVLPGLYARLRVPVEKRKALLVPDEAVSFDQQGSYVLIVAENHRVERRNVKTGPVIGPLRVIESGLDGNEWVIAQGVLRAIPGSQVTPERSEPGPASQPRRKRTGP